MIPSIAQEIEPFVRREVKPCISLLADPEKNLLLKL